jgi:PTS system nitrogen regulatory IIA component
MADEIMDLDELAHYLHRDKRELERLAARGRLPGRKVGSQWRFARAEINHWIETQLPEYSEKELTALEDRAARDRDPALLLSDLLRPASMAVPLPAATRDSVLRELVQLAEATGKVYDSGAIFTAICQREEMATTALESGVAIPHPRRPLPSALESTVVAYGKTGTGIPFGAAHGGLSDLFFLVCCRDETTHLAVLARLSRLLLRPGFVDDLRAASSVEETWQLILSAERELGSQSSKDTAGHAP